MVTKKLPKLKTELANIGLELDVDGNLIFVRGQVDPGMLLRVVDDETMIVLLRIFLRHFDYLEKEIEEYLNEAVHI